MKIYLTFYSVSSWSISLLFDDMYDFSDSFFYFTVAPDCAAVVFFFYIYVTAMNGCAVCVAVLKLVFVSH